jgi:hypothetical protein
MATGTFSAGVKPAETIILTSQSDRGGENGLLILMRSFEDLEVIAGYHKLEREEFDNCLEGAMVVITGLRTASMRRPIGNGSGAWRQHRCAHNVCVKNQAIWPSSRS